MLLGLIVAIAVMLLWLGAAATTEAFAIRRDREAETVRRADQYVRAIRLYYRKFGHYPGSMEQLENSNNIRFLRRRWVDPLTGVDDWRTIAVGKNQTTPRGFFGEPLAGLTTSGLGALAGSQSPGMPGSPAAGTQTVSAAAAGPSASGAANVGAAAASPGSPTIGAGTIANTPAAGAGSSGAAATGAPNASGGSSTTAASGGSSSNGAGGTPTGAFIGVGVNATGNSLLEVNGQSTYQSWEFLYDPRVEQLRLQQQLNSGVQSTSAGSLGQQPNSLTPQAGPFSEPQSPPAPATPGTAPAPQGTANPGSQTPIVGVGTPNLP